MKKNDMQRLDGNGNMGEEGNRIALIIVLYVFCVGCFSLSYIGWRSVIDPSKISFSLKWNDNSCTEMFNSPRMKSVQGREYIAEQYMKLCNLSYDKGFQPLQFAVMVEYYLEQNPKINDEEFYESIKEKIDETQSFKYMFGFWLKLHYFMEVTGPNLYRWTLLLGIVFGLLGTFVLFRKRRLLRNPQKVG